MENVRFGKLYGELMVKLEKSAGLAPLERMKAESAAVAESLGLLRDMVLADGFADEAEEMDYFKLVKPRFAMLGMLAVERYNYEMMRPVSGEKELADFFSSQVAYVSRSLRSNPFFYEYYKIGGSELDPMYFMRMEKLPAGLGVCIPELDCRTATVGDYLFSRFMALEKLQEHILLDVQGPALVSGSGLVSKKGRELVWTGDSCNLIEMIYGIFDCKQVNKGNVDLSDLMDVFGQVFQINLSRYFRRFTEIKRRKAMSKTRFLDQMRDAVNKRIDDGDAYVPMSMRSR